MRLNWQEVSLLIRGSIVRKLEAMSVDAVDVDAKTTGKLDEIEEGCQAEEAELTKAGATVGSCGFALSTVPTANGVSRATSDSKSSLAEYVEFSEAGAFGDDDVDTFRTELRETKEKVRLRMGCDGEFGQCLRRTRGCRRGLRC